MCSRKECCGKYPCYCRTCHVKPAAAEGEGPPTTAPPPLSTTNKKTSTKPQLNNDWREEKTARTLLNSTRRANHDDLYSIKSLIGTDNVKIFGEPCLSKLIEKSLLFQVVLNFENRVIGAICLNDFPPVQFLTENDWADWLERKYNCSKFQWNNTLWIHFLAYGSKFKDVVFDHLFTPIFLEFPYIQSLAIFVEAKKFIQNYLPQFHHIGRTVDQYSRPTLIDNNEPVDIPVFYLDRNECVYSLKVRRAVSDDEVEVMKTIAKEQPVLVKYYGKNLFKYLLSDPNRNVFIAPNELGGRVGVVLINTSINFQPIQEQFETEYYNGFKRGSDLNETWCNHYYPKRQNEYEEEGLSK